MTLHKVSLPFLFISLFVLPASAEAAISQEIPPGATQTTVTVVADVNLTDVVATEKNGTFSGTFALKGNMGLQGDIVYGVIVTDNKGSVLSATKLGDATAIQEGEIKTYSFSYTLPTFLKGEATVLLVAETTGGLRLGTYILAKRTFTGPGSTTSCSMTTATTLGCTFAKAGSATVSLRNALLSTSDIKSETLTGTAGAKKSFEVVAAPGIYYLFVSEGSTVTRVLSARVPGSYGVFRNIAVASEKEGEVTITATYLASPAKGASLSYSLSDSAGKVCTSGTETTDGGDVVVTLKTSCSEGTLSTKLLAADGTLLTEKTLPFSVLRYEPAKPDGGSGETSTLSLSAGWIALILVVISLLGVVLLRAKLRGATVYAPKTEPEAAHPADEMTIPPSSSGPTALLFLLVLGASFVVQAPNASAATLSLVTRCMNWTEVSHIADFTMSPGKSAYKPGEETTFTASVDLDTDVCDDYATITVGYKTVGGPVITGGSGDTTVLFDTGFSPPTQGAIAFLGVWNAHSFPSSYSDTLSGGPAPMAVGSHYLAMRPLLESRASPAPSALVYDSSYLSTNVMFDVVNVNVQFSPAVGGGGGIEILPEDNTGS